MIQSTHITFDFSSPIRWVCALILISGILLLTPINSYSQNKVESIVSRNQFMMGEQLTLQLQAQISKSDTIHWPALKDSLSASLEIVEMTDIDTVDISDTRKELKQFLLLTSFDTGVIYLPSLTFIIDGKEYFTPRHTLQVSGIKIDSTSKLWDIKPPFTANYTLLEKSVDWTRAHSDYLYLTIAIIVLLFITICLFIYNLVIIGKKKREEAKRKPKVPPYQLAIMRLQRISKLKLAHRKSKVYYSALSSILRQYIEDVYYISALEMTTNEIIRFAKRTSIDSEDREKLKKLLELADLAKFAKWQSSESDNELCLQYAFDFIQNTHNQLTEIELEEEELEKSTE